MNSHDDTAAAKRIDALRAAMAERILILDGATGTMIQTQKLDEGDYRGPRFQNHGFDLKGNADILNLTQPDLVTGLHLEYFEAGADIVETNTFNATSIAQADYGTQDLIHEINREGAAIAHQVHGAIGFTDEHILHRFTRRLWAWRDDFGSESEWAVGLGALVAANGADQLWPMVASR